MIPPECLEDQESARSQPECAEVEPQLHAQHLAAAMNAVRAALPVFYKLADNQYNVETWGIMGRIAALEAARDFSPSALRVSPASPANGASSRLDELESRTQKAEAALAEAVGVLKFYTVAQNWSHWIGSSNYPDQSEVMKDRGSRAASFLSLLGEAGREEVRGSSVASRGGTASPKSDGLRDLGDLTTPYRPVAIHFEAPDTLDFVERDVPTVARPVYSGLDVLLDLATREPIGWRIYGWSRIGLGAATASPERGPIQTRDEP